MRVAALYDIHGNLPALEAVLDDIRSAGVDEIVVGGDVVLGPMPNETLASLLVLDLPVRFIEGNCDREVSAEVAGDDLSHLPAQVREIVSWVAQQMPPGYVHELNSWPKTLRRTIDGLGDVLFCHATPRNDNEIFTQATREEVLLPVLRDVDAAVVVCGHTHMQFDRTVGALRVINAGSVGMPFGEPGADWLLLGPDVELRHTTYDIGDAAARVRATSFPYANQFASQSILQPPTKETMLEVYAKMELTP
ncbi:MAG: Calcineurin-like phosphoesterase superfamily domain protein [Gemmatimonadetes bacterium]|nr:Calcineurin-like phosphoesterase superfamily domain protein [Gemmatimonadota bacterium]